MSNTRTSNPIDTIEWVSVNELEFNDYNPNKVFSKELSLLKFSMVSQGWIQPVLVNEDDTGNLTVIDGFHRTMLTKEDPELFAMTGGKVPIVKMKLSEPERMLLTIRINRAKGSHVAIKMHEIIQALIHKHQYSIAKVCEGIGAEKHEIEMLLQESVFMQKDVANVNYSKSWYPKLEKNNHEKVL